MSKTAPATLICEICKKPKSPHEGMLAELIRPSLLEFIKKRMPGWEGNGFICLDDLGNFRKDYVKEVLQGGNRRTFRARPGSDRKFAATRDPFERHQQTIREEADLWRGLSDRTAEFGGSWKFLITFFSVLVVWIIINGFLLLTQAFDPYPFILLNLILSCLAAVQAPVIMMSQNRAEARDRLRAENDYKVNLKAELEIRHLHEKIDPLLRRQYNRSSRFSKFKSNCWKNSAANVKAERGVRLVGEPNFR